MTKAVPLSIPAALRDLRQTNLKCTQTGLAGLLGVSLSTIAKWETGQVKPSPMACKALAKLDPKRRDWWLSEAGDESLSEQQTLDAYKKRQSYVQDDMLIVPIITAVIAAGPPSSVGFSDEEYEGSIAIPIPRGGSTGSMAAVRVRGTSMVPKIADGSLAILDLRRLDPAENVGHIVAARGADGLTLKYLRRYSTGYCLVAANSDYEPNVQPIDNDSPFTIAGRLHTWITECRAASDLAPLKRK